MTKPTTKPQAKTLSETEVMQQRILALAEELCSNLVYGRSTTSLRRVAHCC
jgi:hypothetical protein